MITTEFVMAGNATFTLEIPAEFRADKPVNPHYTYRVRKAKANDRWPEAWFINLLTGPENTADYQPIGKVDPQTGEVRLTRNSKFTDDTWPVRLINRALIRLWKGEGQALEAAGFKMHHEGRCCRCGRLLTVPESIESGIGPECASRMGV